MGSNPKLFQTISVTSGFSAGTKPNALNVNLGLYPHIVLIVSHISQVVMFDSGGAPAVSADAGEKREVGSIGDGTGDGDREGTCTTVTAS